MGFIVSAVSAYSAALRLAQLESCSNETTCDYSQLANGVTHALRKLNFPTGPASPFGDEEVGDLRPTDATVATGHELEGTRGRINHQGKLVSRKYDLYVGKPHSRVNRVSWCII